MLNKCNILSISSTTAKINIALNGGCFRGDATTAKLHIYRYGFSLPLLEYPVFEVRPDQLSFYVDSLLHDLPDGRYYGLVIVGDDTCGRVELSQDNSCSTGAASCESASTSVCLDADPSSCEGSICS